MLNNWRMSGKLDAVFAIDPANYVPQQLDDPLPQPLADRVRALTTADNGLVHRICFLNFIYNLSFLLGLSTLIVLGTSQLAKWLLIWTRLMRRKRRLMKMTSKTNSSNIDPSNIDSSNVIPPCSC